MAETKIVKTSATARLPDGSVELTITISWNQVKKAYDEAVESLAKETEVKGFRKGKAPRNLVEEQLDKGRIYEVVLKNLLPTAYVEAVREHNLTPIVNPQVTPVAMEEGKDWVIRAKTTERPKVELGNYKEEVRKALAAEKIWVPGKSESQSQEEATQAEEKKMAKIFDTLLAKVGLEVPTMLVEEEVNRMLSRLLDQTQRLGITVEQYLTSTGKTSEQIRQEYRKTASDSIKLELILSAIAEKEGVEVPDSQVEAMIAATPDEAAKNKLNNPAEKAYIRQLLRKRAVIDNLMKL